MVNDITTPKLADLKPTWAPFRGWTLLYELAESGALRTGVRRLDVDLSDSRNSLLGRLDARARQIRETNSHLPIALLPATTYHVTVMDGLSTPHIARLAPDLGARLERELAGLPDSVRASDRLTLGLDDRIGSLCSMVSDEPTTYFVSSIRVRGHAVVANLRPAAGSIERHARIDSRRSDVLADLERATALHLTTSWQPHLTLGYVANRSAAAELDSRLGREGAIEVTDETVTFVGAALYGFTTMADYWRSSVEDRAVARWSLGGWIRQAVKR